MATDFYIIRDLEERLLSGEVRRSKSEISHLLSATFVEFGASGKVWSRDEIIRKLSQEQPAARKIDNFHARLLAPGVVLATYQVRRLHPDGSLVATSLRSSVWSHDADEWKLVFHQGTPQPL